jgi:hypothetical protein
MVLEHLNEVLDVVGVWLLVEGLFLLVLSLHFD